MLHEYAFETAASAIRFGAGATREVGADLAEMGVKHVLVFTDPNLRQSAAGDYGAGVARGEQGEVYGFRPGAGGTYG